jgi:hypothetical protein
LAENERRENSKIFNNEREKKSFRIQRTISEPFSKIKESLLPFSELDWLGSSSSARLYL